MAILINILSSICEALKDVEKLPAQMIMAGSVLAAAGVKLVINKASTPRDDDVFLHRREEAPLQLKLYYAALITVVLFGLVEAFAGVWLLTVTGDLMTSQAIGKAILGISIFPLIIVAGLGGFA